MNVKFIVKNKRVKRIIENHRVTISKLKGDIDTLPIDQAYLDYFRMSSQLDGLKVDLDN